MFGSGKVGVQGRAPAGLRGLDCRWRQLWHETAVRSRNGERLLLKDERTDLSPQSKDGAMLSAVLLRYKVFKREHSGTLSARQI